MKKIIKRSFIHCFLAVIVINALSVRSVYCSEEGISQLESLEEAFIRVAEDVKPAVVNISTTYKAKHPQESFGNRDFEGPFKDFFGEDLYRKFFKNLPQGEIPQKSLGSGLIVSPDGYILTNNHVVEKADKIEVRLSDKTKFKGEVIGKDPKTDVAIIKINPNGHKLAVAKLGDSDKCRVGQWAIAIGNPFGLDRTVTVGVVSATGRSDIGIAAYENFIQTDASINHGNSGGPLVNIGGEVIGINTAIVASGQGIGFAIPINMASNIMAQLIKHGQVIRGWMGIGIQQVTEGLGKQFGVEEGTGVLVGQVFKGDPAETAGLKVGDIILKFNNVKVNDPAQLSRLAAATPPDKEIKLLILRDKKEKTIAITMGKQKDEPRKEDIEKTDNYGMKVQELTPQLAKKFGISEKEGVLVSAVTPGRRAALAGIRPGDLIVEVNHNKIDTLESYQKIMASIKDNESILILRIRNGNSLYTVIEPAEEDKLE